MRILEREVQKGILAEFREIDRIGGVIEAIEHRYQRSQIQEAAHRYERQVNDGTRPIIGLNRYWNEKSDLPELKVVRTPRFKKHLQIRRLREFKRRHAKHSELALDRLAAVVETGGSVFEELIRRWNIARWVRSPAACRKSSVATGR
jgi:methylmalonyl-CoA mutase